MSKVANTIRLSSTIIRRPRITEKAAALAEVGGVYAFEVDKRANKTQIKEAINDLYKVQPIKIAIVTVPSKTIRIRRKKGVKSGFKKAYVYLKKGDKIDFV